MPRGRLWLSQIEGKPSGGERWEGATIEQGGTDTLAWMFFVLQTNKENNVKLTLSLLSLLDVMAEAKIFSI